MQTVGLNTPREELLDRVFTARTREEIAAAQQALRDWLVLHPDEPGMADAFEVLAHLEEAAMAVFEVVC
jgi:hypothetical protein